MGPPVSGGRGRRAVAFVMSVLVMAALVTVGVVIFGGFLPRDPEPSLPPVTAASRAPSAPPSLPASADPGASPAPVASVAVSTSPTATATPVASVVPPASPTAAPSDTPRPTAAAVTSPAPSPVASGSTASPTPRPTLPPRVTPTPAVIISPPPAATDAPTPAATTTPGETSAPASRTPAPTPGRVTSTASPRAPQPVAFACEGTTVARDPLARGWSVSGIYWGERAAHDRITIRLVPDADGDGQTTRVQVDRRPISELTDLGLSVPPEGDVAVVLRFSSGVSLPRTLQGTPAQQAVRTIGTTTTGADRVWVVLGVAGEGCTSLQVPFWADPSLQDTPFVDITVDVQH